MDKVILQVTGSRELDRHDRICIRHTSSHGIISALFGFALVSLIHCHIQYNCIPTFSVNNNRVCLFSDGALLLLGCRAGM